MKGPKYISGKYRARDIQDQIEALGPGESVTFKRSEFPKIMARERVRISEPTIEECAVRLLWRIPESDKNISFNSDMKHGLITFTRRESPAPPGTLTYLFPNSWRGDYIVRSDGLYEKSTRDD